VADQTGYVDDRDRKGCHKERSLLRRMSRRVPSTAVRMDYQKNLLSRWMMDSIVLGDFAGSTVSQA
jgi:hypothetical protein